MANHVQRLTFTHEALLNWLVENPEKSLRECADAFGYTQPWVSRIIHSDIFQARLAERQDIVFSFVAADIPEKLRGVANIALERLADKVSVSEDPKFILDVADKAMHRLGYAPKAAATPILAAQTVNMQNNTYVLNAEDLAGARAKLLGGTTTPAPPPTVPEALDVGLPTAE